MAYWAKQWQVRTGCPPAVLCPAIAAAWQVGRLGTAGVASAESSTARRVTLASSLQTALEAASMSVCWAASAASAAGSCLTASGSVIAHGTRNAHFS